jgi:6-pyruvoyltetrahydropterin/6-carboxytetrahydropterin synthase
MWEIKVEKYFAGAHHLLNYDGDCENQHGHNWKVEVYVKGDKLNESNILVDFKVLKKQLDAVLDLLDHKDLNQLEFFKDESPSSERIAKFIYEKMMETTPLLHKVSVWETPTSCATYWAE